MKLSLILLGGVPSSVAVFFESSTFSSMPGCGSCANDLMEAGRQVYSNGRSELRLGDLARRKGEDGMRRLFARSVQRAWVPVAFNQSFEFFGMASAVDRMDGMGSDGQVVAIAR